MNHDRRETLAARLAALEDRLAAACAAVGRSRDELTLVAVTKTFPVSDVRILAGLGISDIGENRDQEAAAKAQACADLGLTWHFVGQLQTNKCRSVAGYAHVVHSVDRPRLVAALSAAAVRADRVLTCLVQVRLNGDPGRGGAPPAAVPELAMEMAAAPGLRLGGIMGVAPLGADPAEAFGRLREVSARVRADHPEADILSAGMSGDLEAAVAAGATHVRVGAALLGPRPPLR